MEQTLHGILSDSLWVWGDQRGQTGEKIQGFKDDVSGPSPRQRLEDVNSLNNKALKGLELNSEHYLIKQKIKY